jgi:hypothetical protein
VPWNGKCWYILWPLWIFYSNLVYFLTLIYTFLTRTVCCHLVYFPTLVCLDQDKSGNPGCEISAFAFRFFAQWCFLRPYVDTFQSGLPDSTHISKPKIHNWVKFGGPCNGRFGIFYVRLVYFMVLW